MSDVDASVAPEEQEEGKLKVNRQEFLNLAWLASMGFLVVELSGITIAFAYPQFKEGEFGGIFKFGSLADLPEQLSPPVNVPKVKLWLSYTSEGLMALYKICPHLGCLYGWSDQEFKFICPCHGSQYEHNGDYIKGPAPRSLDRFAFQIVDGDEVLATNKDFGYGAVDISGFPDSAVIEVDTGDKMQGEVHD